MTTWMTERWVEPYGFAAHAAALLWLLDVNQVTELEIVQVISAGVRSAGDEVPAPAAEITGTTNRAAIVRDLGELARDAPSPATGEVLLHWLADSELPARVLGASAAAVIRLLGPDHVAYHELARVDEMHAPGASSSETDADVKVLEAFRLALASIGAADESLGLQRRIQAATKSRPTVRRGLVRWLRERRRE